MQHHRSEKLFSEARDVIPGGVNSPVRSFSGVGGSPFFVKKAKGAYLWDEDENKYVDFVGSWGPAILGHAHPEVVKAVSEVAQDGLTFGAPTARETEFVREIQRYFPSMEMMRLVSSGTEACMAALRVARGYTKRSKIIKFEGCYHGHADMLLVKAGSGAATLGIPSSAGVPQQTSSDTLVCPFNDVVAFKKFFESYGSEIACVIVEPIVGNAGFIRPTDDFLQCLAHIPNQYGSLLIFDEVMTGFRVHRSGAQALFNVKPDLTVLGKIVGGGMPLAAYGGSREVMSVVSPLGPVYQAGTLSGNPLSVAAGLSTLKILARDGGFEAAAERTKQWTEGLQELARKRDIPFTADFSGAMFGFFFSQQPVRNYSDAQKSDTVRFKKFFWDMLHHEVYLAPSAFEAGFVSAAHSPQDIDFALSAARKVFERLT